MPAKLTYQKELEEGIILQGIRNPDGTDQGVM